MGVAITSLLRGIPVRSDVAMTGEVTLTGKVLPIGGLPEKAVAAIRAGSKHLIIPRDNEKDFLELAEVIRKQLTVHLVERMDEVLALALVGGNRKPARPRRKAAPGAGMPAQAKRK
jgi:ATP-dependent Lon protease